MGVLARIVATGEAKEAIQKESNVVAVVAEDEVLIVTEVVLVSSEALAVQIKTVDLILSQFS